MNSKTTRILGIDFFTGTLEESLEVIVDGGLVVAPAAPALAVIEEDRGYYESVQNSDLILTDSGFMVLLWMVMKRKKIPRHSGLKFLERLLQEKRFQEKNATFWVMPEKRDDEVNRAWLKTQGIEVAENYSYLAPMYEVNRVEDLVLLEELNSKKPPFVVINIGGGIQEKLGYYLKRHLDYDPVIICTGAAIAFLSGQQAKIPRWADRLFLGWFMRCLRAPGKFIPRYWLGRKMIGLVFRFGQRCVPARKK